MLFRSGVTRLNCFSPNHIGNDAAIFNLTSEALKEMGHNIDIVTEQQYCAGNYDYELIFNMVRSVPALDKLIEAEKKGVRIINSANGIINCTREKMTTILLENNVPHPKSLIVNTTDDISEFLNDDIYRHCWIKRGDFHAIHREDVSFVSSPEEGNSILKEYALRGIERAVINEHLQGDQIGRAHV